jgi:hypothetical protein
VVDVADPWITLAAIATATERIRLGPMVTPLARRRPAKVAGETATLDRLSDGRLTLGVGLGSDRFGSDFSITGEELDERRRARMLDESLEILMAAWSGEPVHHRGEHYTVEGMRFLPRPVQRPGVPVWVEGSYGRPRPLRRAARYQGFVPVDLEHPDQLAEMVADLAALRREARTAATEPSDIVAGLPVGNDPEPYDSWHSGGEQAIDVSDPDSPAQAGWFSPTPLAAVANEDPALSAGPNKVVVWSFPIIRDRLIYDVDIRNGLYVLRYSGPHASEAANVSFLEGNSNLGDAGRLAKSG